ncbi:NfeD family protein [Agrococcus sp. HG114]|uniref:NfeD family protein n=1 Tax=Agrococcus sp. HG114 TaxID=2969757 RepID=UPI00215B166F|nr:NfeD family protein [Agrococcus sp. HG114]MCR8669717.1 NfeD family protein [Agrococcus sp. HG114]
MDLAQYAWIVWLVVALICFIVEMVTLEFTFLMIGMASVAGLVSSITGLPVWAQVLIAAGAALLLLFLVRPKLLQRLHESGEVNLQGVDALIGMAGEVTRTFERGAGEVTLANGDVWTARLSPAVQPRDPDVGERIVVTAIEGATALVVPAQR